MRRLAQSVVIVFAFLLLIAEVQRADELAPESRAERLARADVMLGVAHPNAARVANLER
jgi:hypothetical protein